MDLLEGRNLIQNPEGKGKKKRKKTKGLHENKIELILVVDFISQPLEAIRRRRMRSSANH